MTNKDTSKLSPLTGEFVTARDVLAKFDDFKLTLKDVKNINASASPDEKIRDLITIICNAANLD